MKIYKYPIANTGFLLIFSIILLSISILLMANLNNSIAFLFLGLLFFLSFIAILFRSFYIINSKIVITDKGVSQKTNWRNISIAWGDIKAIGEKSVYLYRGPLKFFQIDSIDDKKIKIFKEIEGYDEILESIYKKSRGDHDTYDAYKEEQLNKIKKEYKESLELTPGTGYLVVFLLLLISWLLSAITVGWYGFIFFVLTIVFWLSSFIYFLVKGYKEIKNKGWSGSKIINETIIWYIVAIFFSSIFILYSNTWEHFIKPGIPKLNQDSKEEINLSKLQIERNEARRDVANFVKEKLSDYYSKNKIYPRGQYPISDFLRLNLLNLDEENLYSNYQDLSEDKYRICYLSKLGFSYILYVIEEPNDAPKNCYGETPDYGIDFSEQYKS